MFRIVSTALIAATLCVTAFAAQPPRIAGDEGATFEDLIREQRLVTITLSSGAQDFDLKVTGVYADKGTLSVVDATGRPSAYRFDKISEVRVQKGPSKRGRKPDPDTVLTAEDRKIVDSAAARAMSIFTESHLQPEKMMAAGVIAASTHDKKNDAISYLKDLSKSNDVPTALLATQLLWENGESPSSDTILTGLNSGNRSAKSYAIVLVGLTQSGQFITDVRRLLSDPSIEISAAAAIALGRLNDLQSVPTLIQSLASITEEKAQAALIALSYYKDPAVKRDLETALAKAEGLQRFRIVAALFDLGDENARKMLATEYMREPAYDKQSAIALAEDGDPDALKWLRDFLQKSWDPNLENLIYRAAAGLCLYLSGDIQSKNTVSDILNTQPNDIYAPGKTSDQKFKEATVVAVQAAVSLMIGMTMRRDMLPVLAGPMQSANNGVALLACRSILQVGNREFGKRVNYTFAVDTNIPVRPPVE
jgi:HEAT repeat protein